MMFKLKELRMEYGITRAELSRNLGINQGTLANYENEIREADYKTLMRIASFFEVSVDYLIGYDAAAADKREFDFKPLKVRDRRVLSQLQSLTERSRELIEDTIEHISTLESQNTPSLRLEN